MGQIDGGGEGVKQRKSGDWGKGAGVTFGSTGLMGVRDSPRDVRREKGEKTSWCEGEERREAAGEAGQVQARCPHRYPGGSESGEGGQGIPPVRGQPDRVGVGK